MKNGNQRSSFVKLKNNFIVPGYEPLDVQISYGVNIDGQFKGIQYLNLNSLLHSQIYSVLPERCRKDFFMSLMKVNHSIPPHTDSGINSTINFYIKTENCLTQFYKFKDEQPNTYQIDNQTNGFIYQEDDLEKTESFIAKDNEVWLLDVTRPHAVKPNNVLSERLAITLGTQYYYQDVCQILKETGNL